MRDYGAVAETLAGGHFETPQVRAVRLNEGAVEERAEPKNGLFYTILSEQCGENIEGEEHLMSLMQGLVRAKKAYDRVESALASAREDGYGLVMPVESEMTLDKP